MAMSRVKFVDGLKIILLDFEKKTSNVTRNVIYIETFQNILCM